MFVQMGGNTTSSSSLLTQTFCSERAKELSNYRKDTQENMCIASYGHDNGHIIQHSNSITIRPGKLD